MACLGLLQVVTHRGALLGLVLRSQLLVMLKHREFVFNIPDDREDATATANGDLESAYDPGSSHLWWLQNDDGLHAPCLLLV